MELAFPWKGMKEFTAASGRSLPPVDGDVWRIDFSRFNQYKEAPPAEDVSGWSWTPHRLYNSHIPECFTAVQFRRRSVKDR